jgi:dihydroneopterin aldolase
MSDGIKLIIRDLRVDLRIGHCKSEQGKTQPILINIECMASLIRRYDDIRENDLSAVINYRPVYEFIHDELMQMGHIFLLESAAEKILDFCFRDPRITTASVRMEKTTIFPDAASGGIEMKRTRS